MLRIDFKVRDIVFVYGFGWGCISDIDLILGRVMVVREEEEVFVPFSLVSYKEYSLNGVVNERPKSFDYVGKWGVFSEGKLPSVIGVLHSVNYENEYPYYLDKEVSYKNFYPLTEEQIKLFQLSVKGKY